MIAYRLDSSRYSPKNVTKFRALLANNGIQPHATHAARITPPEMAHACLPWVHIGIANLIKRFLLGTSMEQANGVYRVI